MMGQRNIRAGELNQRIGLLLHADAANAAFGVDASYTGRIDSWAKHEPIHGLVMRAGIQTGETPTDLFGVRVRTGTGPYDITGNHVVEWKGRRYRVLDTIFDGLRNEYTRISVKDLGMAS